MWTLLLTYNIIQGLIVKVDGLTDDVVVLIKLILSKGGRDDGHILKSVEFLPSRTKKNKTGEKKNKEFIERYPPLPYEMEGLSATEIKNVIYLIGTTRWQQESKVLSYELNGKAWKPETNLKRSRHSPIGKPIRS